MNKEKEYKFNIYFKETGEQIDKLIVESIIYYLKNNAKGLTNL